MGSANLVAQAEIWRLTNQLTDIAVLLTLCTAILTAVALLILVRI